MMARKEWKVVYDDGVRAADGHNSTTTHQNGVPKGSICFPVSALSSMGGGREGGMDCWLEIRVGAIIVPKNWTMTLWGVMEATELDNQPFLWGTKKVDRSSS